MFHLILCVLDFISEPEPALVKQKVTIMSQCLLVNVFKALGQVLGGPQCQGLIFIS